MKVSKKWRCFSFLLLIALFLIQIGCSGSKAQEAPITTVDTDTSKPSVTANGMFTMEMGAYDWGPVVGRIILSLDTEILAVDSSAFDITEIRQISSNTFDIQNFERIVMNAFLSDENGVLVEKPSRNITVELQVQPDGIVMYWNTFLEWPKTHRFNISLSQGKTLESKNGTVETLALDEEPAKKIAPLAERFQDSSFTYGKITYSYTSYSPKEDNGKNPLVIWLHGYGEGGTDVSIVKLGGSKVTALVDDKIQDKLGGAYILIPQCPTYWMDSGYYMQTKDGSNIYTESLMTLIKNYVDSNEDIDTDRIYIGGCSNGGYMTMDLIINYPDYFAAAYPICQAYYDIWISDEQIEAMKNIPIWFTHAENDTTISAQNGTFKTYDRLLSAGAKNIYLSRFKDVRDRSGLYKDVNGAPFVYHPHCSWIYVLNDECLNEATGETIFEWMAKQRKN